MKITNVDDLVTFIVEMDYVAPIINRDIAFIDCASSVDAGLCSFSFWCAHDRPERKISNMLSAKSNVNEKHCPTVSIYAPIEACLFRDRNPQL